MAVEETAEQSAMLGSRVRAGTAEGSGPRGSVGVPLAFIHLLLELLCLLLVDETQASQTVFQLKGVEKGAVLVVGPRVEDFLIPDDAASGGGDVHHLYPVRVAHQVVDENNGALEPRVRPFGPIRIGDVEAGDGDGLDLVILLGNDALDGVLVVFV